MDSAELRFYKDKVPEGITVSKKLGAMLICGNTSKAMNLPRHRSAKLPASTSRLLGIEDVHKVNHQFENPLFFLLLIRHLRHIKRVASELQNVMKCTVLDKVPMDTQFYSPNNKSKSKQQKDTDYQVRKNTDTSDVATAVQESVKVGYELRKSFPDQLGRATIHEKPAYSLEEFKAENDPGSMRLRNIEFYKVLKFMREWGVRLTPLLWNRTYDEILVGATLKNEYQDRIKGEIESYGNLQNELTLRAQSRFESDFPTLKPTRLDRDLARASYSMGTERKSAQAKITFYDSEIVKYRLEYLKEVINGSLVISDYGMDALEKLVGLYIPIDHEFISWLSLLPKMHLV